MSYSVKEIFYSLQGEGAQTGRPAVFCRFSGCNLWSGELKHRASAECNFCDTDFIGVGGIGGGKFKAPQQLADEIAAYWPEAQNSVVKPYVVFTGGEPLLQLDEGLIQAMHVKGFEVGVETNGTLAAPKGIDWLCVSPKGKTKIRLQQGSELKLVYPQTDAQPERFSGLCFEHFYLQPMEIQADMAQVSAKQTLDNVQSCMDYCLTNPQWKLSLQTHKTLGIR